MVVDTTYYEALEVSVNADSLTIKKAYRKQSLIHHPDKNPDDPSASLRFQLIGEAYQVLSNDELRKKYDTHGKESAKPDSGFGIILSILFKNTYITEDPGEFFSDLFGGQAFADLIGEISLIKDLQKAAEITTNEDGASTSYTGHGKPKPGQKLLGNGEEEGLDWNAMSEGEKELRKTEKKKGGLTKEQRAQLEAYERERREVRAKRIESLSKNLISKISVWTETDEKSPNVTHAFQEKIKYEAESLKLESFGVELLHAIGAIYMIKGSNFLKSHKYLGMGGFFGKLKDKGNMVKETWNTIASAVDAQMTVEQMSKLEEKGGDDFTPEKRAEMERDVSGKVLLASWRGTKMEVSGVLRSVCDAVLYDKTVSPQKKIERAQALIMVGTIYKNVVADPGDESRVFETLIAETKEKNKRKKTKDNK